MSAIIWNRPGAVDMLRELCGNPDMSASRIAMAFYERYGEAITRNAVIGKATRLKIPLPGAGRIRQERPRPAHPGERRPRAPRHYVRRPPRGVLQCEPVEDIAPVEDSAGAPIDGGLSLLELKHDSCRWPFGDTLKPGLRYCGQPIEEGRFYSFCAFHIRRGTDNAPRRRGPKARKP